MGENSKIEWTDHTFNPWVGCTKVSPGCKHCYAEVQMTRNTRWANTWGVQGKRLVTSDANWRKPVVWDNRAHAAGKPAFVFCGSLCDVFEDREELFFVRLRLWVMIKATPWLVWLLLTKRPENILNMIPSAWKINPPANVAYGTSVENEDYRGRLVHLLQVPIASTGFRFVSAEPLLGELDLVDYFHCCPSCGQPKHKEFVSCNYCETYDDWRGIDWVIVGGESQKGCRPMEIEWARELKEQCACWGVPFFMKQLGGHPDKRDQLEYFPEDLRIRQFPRHYKSCFDK